MADPDIVYFDANIFVQALEGKDDDAIAVRCRKLIELVQSREIIGVTSELTLAEVLIKPSIRRRFNLKRSYLALFNVRRTIFDMRPVTRKILVESVAYRAHVHLVGPGATENKRNFLPDAIHVVTAIEAAAHLFASSDQRIRLPAGMERVDPRGDGLDAILDRVG